ncbi:MAG: alpha/beta hydrolase [Flavobacteriia bacterium]|nr:alpha/beta hydrolase [Flavobacteriia bacterium]
MKKLNYEIYGNGKIVVFIHGFLEDLSIWKNFPLEKLNYTKILIDLPGHGCSICNLSMKSLSDVAKYILINCPELSTEKTNTIDIIGHSLGAYIGIELRKLLKNPGKLIFYHSHFLGDSIERKLKREKAILLVRENKKTFIRESIPLLFMEKNRLKPYVFDLIKKAQNCDLETIVLYLSLMKNRADESTFILSIKENISVIHGFYDQLITEKELKSLKNIITVYTISHTSHMSFLEDKVNSWKVIKKFIFSEETV